MSRSTARMKAEVQSIIISVGSIVKKSQKWAGLVSLFKRYSRPMVEREDNSRKAHDQIRRLFADITGHLEAAHESAVAGQGLCSTKVELIDWLETIRQSLVIVGSLIDKAALIAADDDPC